MDCFGLLVNSDESAVSIYFFFFICFESSWYVIFLILASRAC